MVKTMQQYISTICRYSRFSCLFQTDHVQYISTKNVILLLAMLGTIRLYRISSYDLIQAVLASQPQPCQEWYLLIDDDASYKLR